MPVDTLSSPPGSSPSVETEASGTSLPAEVRPADGWMVPQAAHPGQRPTHRETCCRHSAHARIVRTLATRRTLATSCDTVSDHVSAAADTLL